MQLQFKDLRVRPGLNVTVRNGSKWLVPPGTPLEIVQTGQEVVKRYDGVVATSFAVESIDLIPPFLLSRAHPEARTLAGMTAVLDRAYGEGQWGPQLTVMLYELVSPIPDAVWLSVLQERGYQLARARIGKLPGEEQGWSYAFDDQNGANDWVSYVTRYLGYAGSFAPGVLPTLEQREAWQKVAALAIAAMEAIDRRHAGN